MAVRGGALAVDGTAGPTAAARSSRVTIPWARVLLFPRFVIFPRPVLTR
jgi:hypothetical protein